MAVDGVFVIDEKQGKSYNRIDTAARWQAVNPVLSAGEFGVEKLTGGKCNLKVGDGSTAWNSLPYLVKNG